MKRIGKIEVGTALAALVLAVVAGVYLAVTTFAEGEACYGMVAGRLQCQKLVPGSLEYAQVAGRAALILSIMVALYLVGAAAAWWQSRTQQPDARSTAFGVVVTCALTLIGVTMPAISGVGFFFVPSTVLISLAALIGVVGLVQARGQTHENVSGA